MSAETQLSSLAGGTSDYLISYQHKDVDMGSKLDKFESKTIGKEFLFPVGSRAYASSALQEFYSLVQYSPCSNLRKIVSYMIKTKMVDQNFQIIAEATMEETIKAMVLGGQGIAWLPAQYISKEIKNFTLRIMESMGGIEVDINIYRYRNSLNAGPNTWRKLINDCRI